jgi:Ca2+-binding EF-hand superfamily protein
MSGEPLSCFTDNELRAFRRAFSMVQPNDTGQLTSEHLPIALANAGIVPTRQELAEMLNEIGTDQIDLPNFLTVIYYFLREADTPEELQSAFDAFDENRDGRIPTPVVGEILSHLSHPIPQERIDALLPGLDDGGEIAISALVAALRPA